MGDDRPCNMEGIGTIHIKIFWWDGRKIEGSEVYTSTKKESYLCWRIESVGSWSIFSDGVLKM